MPALVAALRVLNHEVNVYRLVSIWEAQKYNALHVRQSECRGNRPWAAVVFI